MSWYAYILRCGDGSLYTGMTSDVARRFEEHTGGGIKQAKYTQSHPPLRVEAAWEAPDRSAACRLEFRIKALDKARKESLIRGETEQPEDVPGCFRVAVSPKGELL